MAARRILSASLRAVPAPSRSYATSARVPLAFDHHEPPQDGRHRQDAPIIFMHGLFGSKKNNRSVSKALARKLKRHVYAIDLRNHGDSPHAARHDYTAMADDLAGFIGQHGLGRPTLIGHSMGAKAAMALALGEPALVADLVSVDNAPVDAALGGDFAKYVRGMRRVEEAGVTRQADADRIMQEYEESLPIRQFLLGNLHRAAPSSSSSQGTPTQKFRVPLDILAKALDNMGDFPFKDPGRARFEKPALFVRGTRSKYVPDEVLPLIGQFFPRFALVDVDAGHWLISEKPEQFIDAVTEFLTPPEGRE